MIGFVGDGEVLEVGVAVCSGRPGRVTAAEEGGEEDALELQAALVAEVEVVHLEHEVPVEPDLAPAVQLTWGVEGDVLGDGLPLPSLRTGFFLSF